MIGRAVMSEAASSTTVTGTGAEWLSQSWRLTAFLGSASPLLRVNWWDDFVGDEPETIVDNPRQGIRQHQGSYKQGVLILTIQPGRVDWLYTAQRDTPERTMEPNTLGPAKAALADFQALATVWLKSAPPMNRLAAGAVFDKPVESRLEAYTIIMGMVPGLRLDAGSSDFLYQINRRRASQVAANRTINRLSKWSAAALQMVQIEVVPESGGTVRPISEFLTARLEVDINTVPDDRTPLEHDELLPIYDELINLGLEIADKGDIN